MIGCPACGHQFEPPAPAALTQRQRDLLLFIRKYQLERGLAPSYDEMRRAMVLHSKSGVHRIINGLMERGAIRHERNLARSIAITPGGLAAIEDLQRRAESPNAA